METVQLSLSDALYASALRELLEQTAAREVRCVAAPDPKQEGVMVVDADALDSLPLPLVNPERVVLITRNDPRHLAKAWNAGIRSVVFNEDPLSTAVLAIMAAGLRVPKGDLRWAASHSSIAPGATAAYSLGCAPFRERKPTGVTTLETAHGDSKPRKEGLK